MTFTDYNRLAVTNAYHPLHIKHVARAPYDAKYLYLRTKLNVAHSDVPLNKLGHALQEIEDLEAFVMSMVDTKPLKDQWFDGLVLSLLSTDSLKSLCDDLAPELAAFDHWAMIDARGNCIEAANTGPASHFMSNTFPAPFSQLLVRFHDNEPDADKLSEEICGAFGLDRCRAVFHWRNGRTFAIKRSDPANILIRRSEKILERLSAWAVSSFDMNVFGPAAIFKPEWTPLPLWLLPIYAALTVKPRGKSEGNT